MQEISLSVFCRDQAEAVMGIVKDAGVCLWPSLASLVQPLSTCVYGWETHTVALEDAKDLVTCIAQTLAPSSACEPPSPGTYISLSLIHI